MPIYKRGSVQIHYEEAGSGFPLLVIPGGGLNATVGYLSERVPFNPMAYLVTSTKCTTRDLRNASGGEAQLCQPKYTPTLGVGSDVEKGGYRRHRAKRGPEPFHPLETIFT